jgi:diaminopimelate epimerase
MKIPYTKAHGARNDFLLTWREELPEGIQDFAEAARAICQRNTGAGADGWLLISQAVTPDSSVGGAADGIADCSADCSIELWNSDGSRSEISGNGTRCAAALMVETGHTANEVRIATGAGVKKLRLLKRRGHEYSFEMNMGRPQVLELHATIEGRDAVILNVGNPQCAILVDDFDFDWAAVGARVERMPRFPNRTNVSFVRATDAHTVEARFFERGAGVTLSSGTGSTGAAAAVQARGWVESPVRVDTPAGPLHLRWEGADILLAGPAEIVARGEFYWEGSK